MANEYNLSFTASEIDEKLGKVDQLSQDITNEVTNHNTSNTSHEDIRGLITSLDSKVDDKANSVHNHDDDYDAKGAAESAITAHNTNTSAHNDIRELIDDIVVPTKVSELTNDSGYLTSYTETDPTVPAWAKASTKPTYTASEVGADVSGAAASALTDAKSYTDTKIADLINGAPTTLDTLGEIATAMQNNEDVVEALDTAIGTKANTSDLTSHTGNKSNPHGVTAAQVGADPSGSASAVQSNLDTHTNNKSNPHEVTASQIGADPSGSAASVQGNLDTHTGNKSNPHGVTLSQLGLTATATELNYMDGVTSAVQTQLNKKADDFSIELYNGTGGNPKPVRFMTVNYSTCGSENGVAIKVGMVSGHGNGSSYAFLQDAIIKVGYTGNVAVDNFKYYGADTGTYDGLSRQYGDIFWTIDTTNKVVDFYCLMGQYARIQMTPYKRVTYSTGGTITQYTSCTVYSSGDKVWANNDEFALKNDISNIELTAETITSALGYTPANQQDLNNLVASAIMIHSGSEAAMTSSLGEDGDVYLVTE